MSGLTAFELLRIQSDFTISFHLCCDAYSLRSKLFAVNFRCTSVRRIVMAYQFVPLHGWLLPPHRVARYAGGGRGDYKSHRSPPPLRKRRRVLRLPRGTSRYLGSPTIPNDYSSTTTIPKLNFRVLGRTVTMRETYADRCREGHRWGEN
jgi:hypothetical protein